MARLGRSFPIRSHFKAPPGFALVHYSMTADAGSFSLTGQSAEFRYGRLLAGAVGSFTITGQDAVLRQTRKLNADVGAFTLAGQDANLYRGRKVDAELGTFA